MTRLLFIISLILISIVCNAKCVSQDFKMINRDDTISSKGKVIIDFYEYRRYFFNSTKDISIIAIVNGKQYELKLIESAQGFNLVQGIFMFPDSIELGKCTIAIKPLNFETAIEMESQLLGAEGYEPKIINEFYLSNSVGHISGGWSGKPELLKAEYAKLGCGDEIYNEFNIPNSFDQDLIYEVTVINESISTQVNVAFINIESKDKFYIGHDMCYGTFNLDVNESYILKIRAYSQKFDSFSSTVDLRIEKLN